MSDFSRSWAFVIGINNYTNNIPPLQNAVNDAAALIELLREKYGYEVREYLNEAATLKNLHEMLWETLPKEVSASDRLLFYFAGHGIALNGDEPEGYLIPQDAVLGNVQTYLPMNQLYECLNKLPCRHFLGILDCCFAGAFAWSCVNREILAAKTVYKERYERFIADPAWQVITSASYNQKALDTFAPNTQRGDGAHSPFAFSLLEGLKGKADFCPSGTDSQPPGDGVITATELYLYVRDAVELAEEPWRQQTPGLFPLKKHDKGEYIFLPPGHVLNLPSAPPLDESKNPYRGLESFSEEHSKLFFGRQALTQKLYEFVEKQPLTVVWGASGTGKSSLVKAGLIPYINKLESQRNHQQWLILPSMRPGKSPFRALNNTLTQEKILAVDLYNNYQQAIDKLSARMAAWCKRNPQKKLLFVVDQLEEVITLCRDKQERENFLNFLAVAVAKYSDCLRIVLSLRSDFDPQFQDGHLCKYWSQARFKAPMMTREELRKAIEEPAHERVMYFEPHSLVEQLLDEVAQMPGALPLLSFTLSELYLRYLKSCRNGLRDNRAITQQDYDELGGVARSLTQRADCEYEQLIKLDIAYSHTMRHVMLRMVAVGGGELARRQVQLSELEYPLEENARVQEMIRRFTDARLLVKGEDIDDNLYVEPAHDALVQGWQKLLVWKHSDEESLILQRQLTPAANDWANRKSVQFLWNTNPRLPLLKQVLNSDNNWLNKVEAEFVQQSIKRKSFNVRRNWGIAIGTLITLSITTIVAIQNNIDAQNQSLESKILLADNLFTSGQELNALVQATETGEKLNNTFILNEDIRIKVLTTWQKIVDGIKERNRLPENASSVSFSPDGKIIASASNDGIIKLWYNNGQLFQKFPQHSKNSNRSVIKVIFSSNGQLLISASQKNINIWRRQLNGTFDFYKSISDPGIISLALSPDNKTIATGGNAAKKIITLWNLNGKILKTLSGHIDAVNDLSFSPDGQTLASASADNKIKLWTIQENKPFKTIPEKSNMFAVRFIDSQTIAYAGANAAIKLWSLKEGKNKQDFQVRHSDAINGLAVSPNAKIIASASNDGTINIWDLHGTLRFTLRGHEKPVEDINFSPNGEMIASTGEDNTIRIWSFDNSFPAVPLGSKLSFSPNSQMIETGDGKNVSLWGINRNFIEKFKSQHKDIANVSLSPNGKIIAGASADHTIKLWDINGKLLSTLVGHKKAVTSISFSPDSKMIVSGSRDNTVKLWDTQGNPAKTLSGHKKAITSVTFSPDGTMIASSSRDNTIKLWNLHGKILQTIRGHIEPVLYVSFSPDGKMIVSSSEDKTVRLWHINNFLGHLDVHQTGQFLTQDNVFSVKFHPNGQTLALASNDDRVELRNLNGALLSDFRGQNFKSVTDISFSPDGKIFAVSNSGKVTMLNLDLDKLHKFSCSWLHDYWPYREDNQKNTTNICKLSYLPERLQSA